MAPAHSYLTDPEKFEHIWRVATCFARSSLTPDSLRGKPEDCFILTQLAMRLDVDPFMLMQNTYVVHGRPGMEAKLQIGLLNASGRIKGNITYTIDGDGDKHGCVASVVDAASGDTVTGPRVDWTMVKAEGWNKPKGSSPSKWMTMPEIMFRYRAASLLIRAHYPEVTLGLLTKEELEDTMVSVDQRLAAPMTFDVGTSKADALVAIVEQRKAEASAATPQERAEAGVPSVPAEQPKRRGRPPKAKEETAEQPPEEQTEQPASEEIVPQTWFDGAMRRITQCHSILELMPLTSSITNDPMRERVSQEQQEQLANAVLEAQARLE
jgi:hypothetical protein